MQYYKIHKHFCCVFIYFVSLIFDCYLWLVGASPPDLTGALPLEPDGDFRPHTPFCPPVNKILAKPLFFSLKQWNRSTKGNIIEVYTMYKTRPFSNQTEMKAWLSYQCSLEYYTGI